MTDTAPKRLVASPAGYADRKGEDPADLPVQQPTNFPVQQPTKFEFVINLKTRKSARPRRAGTLLALAELWVIRVVSINRKRLLHSQAV